MNEKANSKKIVSQAGELFLNSLEASDVCNLQKAIMEYPTWACFVNLIKEANNCNFPISSFGNKPMGCQNGTLISITPTQSLKSILVKNGSKFVGIDIPVLLKQEGNNKGTIVIVGESPLRDTKIPNNQQTIQLGTPYAVHQEFNCPSQCNVYKMIFSDLLNNGYSIYLTDIIKVWWEGKKLKVEEFDVSLFNDELKSIDKNAIIVAWGKRAADKLKKMNRPFLQLPHPSQQNWNNWKLRIFEKALYDEDKGVDYAKKLYPDKNSTTSEFIVANEVVKEILEHCKSVKSKETDTL